MGDMYQPNITLISSKKNKTKTNRIKVLSSTIAHSIHLCKKEKKKKKSAHTMHIHTPLVGSFVRCSLTLCSLLFDGSQSERERREEKSVCLFVCTCWMCVNGMPIGRVPSNRKENRENGSENERVNSLCSRLCVCVCVCLAVKQPKQNREYEE